MPNDELKQKPTVKLAGTNGKTACVMAKVIRALVLADLVKEAESFLKEALAGNKDGLLQTVQKYVEVE